jgi:putative membrane protein
MAPPVAEERSASPRWPFWLGAFVLGLAWLGPLPRLTHHSFAAHMVLHVTVVAVAAPLIAIGISECRCNLLCRLPPAMTVVCASLLELIVVWAWHAPVLRNAASGSMAIFMVEQASFFAVGFVLWLAAFATRADGRRAMAGVIALLLTSMHMTLLGALLGLSPRPLFHHGHVGALGLTALEDQHIGGIVMLAVGGLAYLAGGLALIARLLRDGPAPVQPAVPAGEG